MPLFRKRDMPTTNKECHTAMATTGNDKCIAFAIFKLNIKKKKISGKQSNELNNNKYQRNNRKVTRETQQLYCKYLIIRFIRCVSWHVGC